MNSLEKIFVNVGDVIQSQDTEDLEIVIEPNPNPEVITLRADEKGWAVMGGGTCVRPMIKVGSIALPMLAEGIEELYAIPASSALEMLERARDKGPTEVETF